MLDEQIVEITCPSCNNKISKLIGWLKKNRQFLCCCGEDLNLNGTELLKKIEECENTLKMLRKQFGNRVKF